MTTARAKTASRGKTARAETPLPMTLAPDAPVLESSTLKTEAPATPAPAAPAPLTLSPVQPAARPRLSDAALLLLGQAAAREDRLLLPPPSALRARGSALQKVLQALLKAGLVSEVPVTTEAQSWRSGDDGVRIGLVIAAEGFSRCRATGACARSVSASSGSNGTGGSACGRSGGPHHQAGDPDRTAIG